MRIGTTLAACGLAALSLGACAAPTPPGQLIADPYENVNRVMHGFNVAADRFVLRPAAQVYDVATPTLFQHMLGNFVEHVRLPLIFINNVLQADVDGALETAGRFGVNTLVGAGGLLDPATEFGLPFEDNGFGVTLAEWGAEEGVFVVLPVLGPATSRDAFGRIGNIAMNPLTYVTFGGGTGQIAAAVGEFVGPVIILRDQNFEIIDSVLYDSEDSYVATRTGYVLSRRNRIADGVVDVEALPDVFAE
ncbi:MlaA family lipoprotein [Rubrimonas cliftonensis]|uniref:Phospholipid-binding lipoprotein MlaA n=1 Tax=Rubrimonas cliftonensis TaxID=89524 RepID=A0A1H3YC66_9RHOB|nr:VacJ family lipoprotein [Rubrimonas cliftonensis]SEA09205.1 phospholipid-binding lipoprotein MlaA [Rubrimonas cliftonensis]